MSNVKHNQMSKLKIAKVERKYVNIKSLRYYKKAAHKEDRRNARISINAELAV